MQKFQIRYTFHQRLNFMMGIIIVLMGIIVLRFFYLQVIQYDFYKTKSISNSLRTIPIAPLRGIIYDRNKQVLAENRLIYNLEINPEDNLNLNEVKNNLAKIIHITDTDISNYKKLVKNNIYATSLPIKIDLSAEEAAHFVAHQFQFPDISILQRQKRFYPFGELSSHAVGYINRINSKDIQDIKNKNLESKYNGVNHIGKTGIEYFYEDIIHGRPGYQQVEVNAQNNIFRIIEEIPAINGDNISLTIDIRLQEKIVKKFENKKGAFVAIDVNNGEILSYVSQPSYDPNLFINGINFEAWDQLNNNSTTPLHNRVIAGLYPPGSTLKPFIALSGIENNLRAPPFAIEDPGFFQMPGTKKIFRDWKKSGHGHVDMIKAIAESCDTFFYGLGLELGMTKMNRTLSQFYFGEQTGLDLAGEKKGLLATPEWKQKTYKKPWYGGETAITAIGQGFTQVTPIQLAYATALLANPKLNKKPHLLLHSTKKELTDIDQKPPAINPASLKTIYQGMEDVTQDGGTAAFIGKKSKYKIAAKTGTAQVFGLAQGEEYDEDTLPEHLKDHALFIAYAPAENPKVAVAVIVENGGHGGSAAGPIAKTFFDHYFEEF
jgi:penicillin-binding protein 2